MRVISAAALVAIAGCETTRVYETSEASLIRAVPAAVKRTMAAEGRLDAAHRCDSVDLNLLGWATTDLKITWSPTGTGQFRVTADAFGYAAITGGLIKFDDPEKEKEFHRELKRGLDSETADQTS